jgi:hypothetical protein
METHAKGGGTTSARRECGGRLLKTVSLRRGNWHTLKRWCDRILQKRGGFEASSADWKEKEKREEISA